MAFSFFVSVVLTKLKYFYISTREFIEQLEVLRQCHRHPWLTAAFRYKLYRT